MKEYRLDEIDKHILGALQHNARMNVKEIAKRVMLSSPAVAKRIQRLEEEGIIQGYQACLNPVALGLGIKAFINLEVEPKQKPIFYPFVRKEPHVIQCNCVTGDYSMILEVLFETTDQLDNFIGTLQEFGRTKTLISFSTSVQHRGIPL